MPRNDVLDDETRLRCRLASLARAMDLTPDVPDEATWPPLTGTSRSGRGALLAAAAAIAIAIVVGAAAMFGPRQGQNTIGVSTSGSTNTPTTAMVGQPAPTTGSQVSDLPVVTPIPSPTLSLSPSGAWPGPGNLDAPRSSPEEAVHSYLAATLGEPAATATALIRLPGVDAAGAVSFFASLPSGATVTVQATPEPSGRWAAASLAIGNTGTVPSAMPGDAPNTALELSVPVVDHAAGARLWYRAGGVTWQMDLGPDVMEVVDPPMPGLAGDAPATRILIPAGDGDLDGLVIVYQDAAGHPLTIHAISGMSSDGDRVGAESRGG